MVLNIFSPFPGGPVGPGIEVRTQAIVSDVPAGSTWVVEVQDMNVANPPQALLRHQLPFAGNEVGPFGLIGSPSFGTLSWPAFRFGAGQDGTVDYSVALISGSTGATIDSSRQAQFWDGSFYYRLAAQASATGGFTQLDREDLAIVKGAVWSQADTGVPGVLGPVSAVIDLVRGPPFSLLRQGGSIPLSGRGVLSSLVDPGGNQTYGASWSWFTIPEGFGFVDGQVNEYFNRIAQFVVVRRHRDGLSNYLDEVIDTHGEGGLIHWQNPPAPVEIRYDIAPGATVIWRWLIF